MGDTVHVPVITVDGPSACGKGTISRMIAQQLGWHFLDSGAFYRAFAWAVLHHQIQADAVDAVRALAKSFQVTMQSGSPGDAPRIVCEGVDVTEEIRLEQVGQMASEVAVIPEVRQALNAKMVQFRQMPGLVADGRDMGTIVFPDAQVKFYLQAQAKERAKRRYKQLKAQGISVNLRDIEHELGVRDQRDAERAIAPAKPAPDVILIDTTSCGVDEVFQLVMRHVHDFV